VQDASILSISWTSTRHCLDILSAVATAYKDKHQNPWQLPGIPVKTELPDNPWFSRKLERWSHYVVTLHWNFSNFSGENQVSTWNWNSQKNQHSEK